MSGRNTTFLLLLVLSVAAVVRIWDIGGESIWLDEAQSLWTASHPVFAIPSIVQQTDQHPPAYYMVLRLWSPLGRTEAIMRMLSALFSLLCLPFVFAIGRQLLSSRAGVLMAALFALSAIHVQYAQEIRMYALLTFTSTVFVWSMLGLVLYRDSSNGGDNGNPLPEGKTPMRMNAHSPIVFWSVYILAALGSLYTSNTAILLLIVAQAIFLLHRKTLSLERNFLTRWSIAHVIILVIYLPWMPGMLTQSAQMSHRFWIPSPDFLYIIRTMGTILTPSGEFVPTSVRLITQAAFAVLAFRGLWSLRKKGSTLLTMLALWLLLPLLEIAISIWKPVFIARSILWTTIPFYGIIIAGSLSFRRSWLRVTAVLFLMVIHCSGVILYASSFHKEDWRSVTTTVEAEANEGELVLFHTATGRLAFDYYRQPAKRRLRLAGVPAEVYRRGWEPRMTVPDMDTLRTRVRAEQRVWLVYTHEWFSDPELLIPRTLHEQFDSRLIGHYSDVELYLYTRRPAQVVSE